MTAGILAAAGGAFVGSFKTVLYTGNGTTQTIDVGFAPDVVWIADRSGAATDQLIFDTERGATIYATPNTGTGELTDANSLTAFTTNGFSLGTDTEVNSNAVNYVAWCWKLKDAYSDIVTYTGTGVAHTESHNLGAVPAVMAVFNRDTAASWAVFHEAADASPETGTLRFNQSGGFSADVEWNNTLPTSSVFSVGLDQSTNTGGDNYVGFFWGEVSGESDFGSYTGNGSASGPTVNTGFAPSMVMIKNVDATANWVMVDKERGNSLHMATNNSSGDISGNLIDLTSTGFNVVSANALVNTNTQTYAYFAWR